MPVNFTGVRIVMGLMFATILALLAACGGSGGSGGSTVTTQTAPTITSVNAATFTERMAGTFTVTATGSPAPTLSLTGTLPTGVVFNAATGVLSGTPAIGTSGIYPLTITAMNGVPLNATQSFTLVVPTTSTNVLIVHDGTVGIESDAVANLSTKLNLAGLTVATNIGVPGGSLFNYRQIWDLRFNNSTPLSVADISAYSTYLAQGGILFVTGEDTAFNIRDASMVSLVTSVGGGTLTVTNPVSNTQTVLAPFATGTLTSVTYTAAAAATSPGTGTFITRDTGNRGTALFFDRGKLANALPGRLTVVFDTQFLQSAASASLQELTDQLIAIQ